MCAKSLSWVQIFATPWTVAHQFLLSMGVFQARILEWVAMHSSRGSSQPRHQTSSPALQVDFLHLNYQGSPRILEWVGTPRSHEKNISSEKNCL